MVSSSAYADKNQSCDILKGNESEVGQGIKDSGVPRSEIFVTSKLWNTHQPNVRGGLQKTLNDLGLDYLDLYVSSQSSVHSRLYRELTQCHQLIHWPVRLVPVSHVPPTDFLTSLIG